MSDEPEASPEEVQIEAPEGAVDEGTEQVVGQQITEAASEEQSGVVFANNEQLQQNTGDVHVRTENNQTTNVDDDDNDEAGAQEKQTNTANGEESIESIATITSTERGAVEQTENAPAATQGEEEQDEGDEESRKMFVGGLHADASKEDVQDYFSQFGEVQMCTVKTDPYTNRSRGFGFLIFKTAAAFAAAINKDVCHEIKGKRVEAKHANPKTKEEEKCCKIFVGGVDPDISKEELMEVFSENGVVSAIDLPLVKGSEERRNFVFITFEDADVVAKLCGSGPTKITIKGKECDVKKAEPKQDRGYGARGGGRGGWGGRGGRGGRGGYGGWGNQGGWDGGYGAGYGGGYGGGYDNYGGSYGGGGGYDQYGGYGGGYDQGGYGGGYGGYDQGNWGGYEQGGGNYKMRRGRGSQGYHPY